MGPELLQQIWTSLFQATFSVQIGVLHPITVAFHGVCWPRQDFPEGGPAVLGLEVMIGGDIRGECGDRLGPCP